MTAVYNGLCNKMYRDKICNSAIIKERKEAASWNFMNI